MEGNEANSTLSPLDENIKSWSIVATTPMDDLQVPPIANNDEGHGGDGINENEDHVEEDDSPAFNMNDLLG